MSPSPSTLMIRRLDGRVIYQAQWVPWRSPMPWVSEIIRGDCELVIDGHSIARFAGYAPPDGWALDRARERRFVDEEIGLCGE